MMPRHSTQSHPRPSLKKTNPHTHLTANWPQISQRRSTPPHPHTHARIHTSDTPQTVYNGMTRTYCQEDLDAMMAVVSAQGPHTHQTYVYTDWHYEYITEVCCFVSIF